MKVSLDDIDHYFEWGWDVEPGFKIDRLNTRTVGQVGISWRLGITYVNIDYGYRIPTAEYTVIVILYDFYEGKESLLERWEAVLDG